jgi:hypothetical protein
MSNLADARADRVAARATGLGIGLTVFMLTWTVGARITERILEAPGHAYVAMAMALLAGTATTIRAGNRLGRVSDQTPTRLRPRRRTAVHMQSSPRPE